MIGGPNASNVAEAQMRAKKLQQSSSLASLKSLIGQTNPHHITESSKHPAIDPQSPLILPKITKPIKSNQSSFTEGSDTPKTQKGSKAHPMINLPMRASHSRGNSSGSEIDFKASPLKKSLFKRGDSDPTSSESFDNSPTGQLLMEKAPSLGSKSNSIRDKGLKDTISPNSTLRGKFTNFLENQSLIVEDSNQVIKPQTVKKRANQSMEISSGSRERIATDTNASRKRNEGSAHSLESSERRKSIFAKLNPIKNLNSETATSETNEQIKISQQDINKGLYAYIANKSAEIDSKFSATSHMLFRKFSSTYLKATRTIDRHELFYYRRNPAKDKMTDPMGRDGATIVSWKDDLLLFGGEVKGKHFGLAVYDIQKEKWKYPKVTGETSGLERVGHCAEIVKNLMIVFGGEKYFELPNKLIQRACTDEVMVYYPHLKQWNRVHTASNTKGAIEPRKYHASCVYNRLLMVYGGILDSGAYMNDFWGFDSDTCKWKKIPTVNKEIDTQGHGIAYHKLCAVFQDISDSTYESKARKIPEGFYVYGGQNDQGEILDTLKVLSYKPEMGGLVWEKPSTRGTLPPALYMHSMSYYREQEMLVIYGGKSGGFFQKGGYQSVEMTIDNVYVLILERMLWVRPRVHNSHSLRPRFGHCSCINSGKLYIFGGTTDDHYQEFRLEKIELSKAGVEHELYDSPKVKRKARIVEL